MTGRLEIDNRSHNDTIVEEDSSRTNQVFNEQDDTFAYDKDIYYSEYLKEREVQAR